MKVLFICFLFCSYLIASPMESYQDTMLLFDILDKSYKDISLNGGLTLNIIFFILLIITLVLNILKPSIQHFLFFSTYLSDKETDLKKTQNISTIYTFSTVFFNAIIAYIIYYGLNVINLLMGFVIQKNIGTIKINNIGSVDFLILPFFIFILLSSGLYMLYKRYKQESYTENFITSNVFFIGLVPNTTFIIFYIYVYSINSIILSLIITVFFVLIHFLIIYYGSKIILKYVKPKYKVLKYLALFIYFVCLLLFIVQYIL